MSTLSFQPEADRYYAQGYWRPGDLWGDFAARAHEQPDKVAALVLVDPVLPYPSGQEADPTVARLINNELRRQQRGLELIASENFASRAVIDAMGTPLTNKYAEGLPGKRYYGGCEVVDEIEQLAIDRAKSLFGAEHANVQPHAGAQANMAAYAAVMQPGDTMLGLALAFCVAGLVAAANMPSSASNPSLAKLSTIAFMLA